MDVAAHWEQHGTRSHYEPGEYIFRLGDFSDSVYFLRSGRVALLKDARTEFATLLGYRQEGDLLGEASLAGEEARLEWALAVEPVTAIALQRDLFWKLLDDDRAFRHEMVLSLVSQLVAADDGRLRANASERDLVDRLSSLSDEHERLAELMQLRNDTTHFIMHDLRNPLNLVRSAVTMLESQTEAADEETRTLILMAQRGVQRMLSLVETLLEVDRLEEGSAAIDAEPTDIGGVLDDVFRRIQPLAAVSDIDMTLSLPAERLPEVMADRQCIDRVMTNLIDNALKYTLPGTRVDLTAWRADDAVYVAVDDEGPGIPQEHRTRIFERFTQAGDSPQGRRGFGLGLAYCRSAMTAHGGKIWVEDAPVGTGMRFVFSLPVSTESE